ncbi:hypothetical protein GXB81_29680 [Paraburkholderia sp. Ac-20336]|uniref:hypothetical protein n=1 Tax=Paraburkholderia sp. Ac-20336 TaxID=2703886 RepID=UPI00197F95E9|nr:hypothetical protein [Paraburkholderia sp. Ac-20336]MBN3807178.1 hypothetical protein [Paraburkholderia sp. Ac-20336]
MSEELADALDATKRVKINFYVSREEHENAKTFAGRYGTSLSKVIRMALKKYVAIPAPIQEQAGVLSPPDVSPLALSLLNNVLGSLETQPVTTVKGFENGILHGILNEGGKPPHMRMHRDGHGVFVTGAPKRKKPHSGFDSWRGFLSFARPAMAGIRAAFLGTRLRLLPAII